jgi:hypothetical protein
MQSAQIFVQHRGDNWPKAGADFRFVLSIQSLKVHRSKGFRRYLANGNLLETNVWSWRKGGGLGQSFDELQVKKTEALAGVKAFAEERYYFAAPHQSHSNIFFFVLTPHNKRSPPQNTTHHGGRRHRS